MSSNRNRKVIKAGGLLSTAASVAAAAMVIRTIANDFIPPEILNYFSSGLHTVFQQFSSEFTIVIEEFRGMALNQVFEAADMYLGSTTTPSVQRLKAGKTEKENRLALSMDRDGVLVDVYENVEMKWKLVCIQDTKSVPFRNPNQGDLSASRQSEVRRYELSFNKKNKDKVVSSYLPYILQRANSIREENKTIKLHTVEWGRWSMNEVKLEHPMTFKTLAMDSELKKAVMKDLESFMNGEEYYKRVGKAWKRGYLLYGPPGTGKSSLIAAMANHLKFDIYDLDLTDVSTNSDLRCLLLGMPSRSILVIEDIDCSIKLENRESSSEDDDINKKVTLSGVLNFIDGLWSCCGEQRIIVFTTNHKEQLDPALLRPGRMDMHVHMSYCNASVLEQLAFNYLGMMSDDREHGVFRQIERLLEDVNVSPAEVAGELMKNYSNEEAAFQGLLKLLHEKISEPDTNHNQKEKIIQEIEQTSDDQYLTPKRAGRGRGWRGRARRGRRARSIIFV